MTQSSRSSRRAALSFALRLGITGGALAWTLTKVSFSEILSALSRIAWLPALAALLVYAINMLIGAVRWDMLLRAYGATTRPSFMTLLRLYWVGLFYNTFLPANVGGDVLRAHSTRGAFESPTSAYVIVLIERVFGLGGLLVLSSCMGLIFSRLPLPGLRWAAVLGLSAAVCVLLAPALLRKVSSRLPRVIAPFVDSLPVLTNPGWTVPVVILSLLTHTAGSITCHILLSSLVPSISVLDSLTLVPIALVSAYFPTVAGLGVREAAFVVLFGKIGMLSQDATAASLAFFGVQLVCAGIGGIVHLISPFERAEKMNTEVHP